MFVPRRAMGGLTQQEAAAERAAAARAAAAQPLVVLAVWVAAAASTLSLRGALHSALHCVCDAAPTPTPQHAAQLAAAAGWGAYFSGLLLPDLGAPLAAAAWWGCCAAAALAASAALVAYLAVLLFARRGAAVAASAAVAYGVARATVPRERLLALASAFAGAVLAAAAALAGVYVALRRAADAEWRCCGVALRLEAGRLLLWAAALGAAAAAGLCGAAAWGAAEKRSVLACAVGCCSERPGRVGRRVEPGLNRDAGVQVIVRPDVLVGQQPADGEVELVAGGPGL